MTQIAVSPFVRRQTSNSRFSHYEGTWEKLLDLVTYHFRMKHTKPGYRDGVVLVEVPPEGFKSGVAVLKPGDKLTGTYEARQEGEDPRKSTCVVGGEKMPAVSVEVVLYRHDVLVETGEHSCNADWEIISVNANPVEGEMPINPGTLMANHFQISGGTATGMSDSEFVAALRDSFLWWRDKAFVAPSE